MKKSNNSFLLKNNRLGGLFAIYVLVAVFVLLTCGIVLLSTNNKASAGITYWTELDVRADCFESGEGTVSDPYKVSTPEQLAYAAYLVNNGYVDDGLNFELTNNINLAAVNSSGELYRWKPIGDSSHPYKGNFNGNGFCISGMYIDSFTIYSGPRGLFGYVSGTASFKNVKVEGVIISSYNDYGLTITNVQLENNKTAIGGLVGYQDGVGVSYTSICSDVNICTPNLANVGGIVGYSVAGKFEQCVSTGTINAKYVVGGIAGKVTTYKSGSTITLPTFTNCYNKSNIKNSNSYSKTKAADLALYSGVGGIVGYIDGDSPKNLNQIITGCYNDGEINFTDGWTIGGIVGKIHQLVLLQVEKCFNNAKISGSERCGGIIGEIFAGSKAATSNGVLISECYNYGTIEASLYAGGILAKTDHASVQQCYNSGNIHASDAYSGGIVGAYFYDGTTSGVSSTILRCYNYGRRSNDGNYISAANGYVGGIIGAIINAGGCDKSEVKIQCCNSDGDTWCNIDGEKYVGGILGCFSSSKNSDDVFCTTVNIVGCKNSTGAGGVVSGGIVGYFSGSGKISNCLNTGTIGGYSLVWGIISGAYVPEDFETFTESLLGVSGVYFGGIVGFNDENSAKVSYCINNSETYFYSNKITNPTDWLDEEPSVNAYYKYVGQIIGRNKYDSSPTSNNYCVSYANYFPAFGDKGNIEESGILAWKEYKLTYGTDSSNGTATPMASSEMTEDFIKETIGSTNYSNIPTQMMEMSDWLSNVSSSIWGMGNTAINNGKPYLRKWYW